MVIDIVLTFFTCYQKELRIEFDETEQQSKKKKINKVNDSIISEGADLEDSKRGLK